MAGFEWVTKEGVLCEEPMRGVAFSVLAPPPPMCSFSVLPAALKDLMGLHSSVFPDRTRHY